MIFNVPQPADLNGTALAYLGDAVIELITRQYLLSKGMTDVGKMNSAALEYVTASSQSRAVEKLLPELNAEEAAVFKRGRNSHGISIPKNARAGDYRRATGTEALFAYLYITGRTERMRELFIASFTEDAET